MRLPEKAGGRFDVYKKFTAPRVFLADTGFRKGFKD